MRLLGGGFDGVQRVPQLNLANEKPDPTTVYTSTVRPPVGDVQKTEGLCCIGGGGGGQNVPE